jgi:GDPmannose 4,6-dehydratase
VASAPTALITGISGQDGSFLAELLLGRDYDVVGAVRPGGSAQLGCSAHLRESLRLVELDLLVPETIRVAVEAIRPQEIYHLAAPSYVPRSWRHPRETLAAIAGATAALLEAVRELAPDARVLIAGSGSMFGEAPGWPQNEETPMRPTTPYAVAKLAGHQLAGAMRRHERLQVSSAIFYNHESERRPEHFVTRRVSRAAAAISLGLESEVTLGSLDAVRDWSFAGDFMQAAWLMLQQPQAGDYVLASGVAHTVSDLVRTAFACVGLDAAEYVRVDEELVRARELTPNVGDASKARELLGWCPTLDFEGLVERMVRADLERLGAGVRS